MDFGSTAFFTGEEPLEGVSSGFSLRESRVRSAPVSWSCSSPPKSFDGRLPFEVPVAGLIASDEMLSFVVVAANGNDLLELPMFRDKYTAGVFSGVEGN